MARRKLIWSRQAPATTSLNRTAGTIGGALETQDLLSVFRTQAGISAGPVGLTVVRLRMRIYWQISVADDLASVNSLGGVYFGVRTWDLRQIAIQDAFEDTTVGPQTDPHADWMAWGVVPMKGYVDSATPFGFGWEDVDIRSMRKFDELGETLGLTLQSTSTVGIGTALPLVVASTSALLALP